MFLLPTRSPRTYHGKYPTRINSWNYSRSDAQVALASFLGIKRPVHLELNDGRRFISDFSELNGNEVRLGVDLEACLRHSPTILVELSQARYDTMLAIVRKAREQSLCG